MSEAFISELEDEIPCEHEDLIVHQNDIFFPPGFASSLILGPSECGKTTLLRRLVPLLSKKIKHVAIITTLEQNLVHQGIGKWATSEKKDVCLITKPK